jgi:enamine deaminase RidA (YjgF/YER057c/UK114 family)
MHASLLDAPAVRPRPGRPGEPRRRAASRTPPRYPAPPVERLRVSSGSPFEPRFGFSRALRVGDRVLVAGTAPVWPDGEVDPDVAAQARRCLEIVEGALAQAGAALDDVVRTRIFVVDAADWEAVAAVHGERFGAVRPVATCVVVAGLLDPRWRVEIEAEAVLSPR